MHIKKNIGIMLLLCVLNKQCMFQRTTYYAAKYIPAILKRLNLSKKTPAVPAGHVISNIDGSPVSQTQFNEIKAEILRPNEFPTALKNPDYNPDADETKVIQQKLDEKYANDLNNKLLDPFNEYSLPEAKQSHVQWVPDTFYDLFRYQYSSDKHDEYKVNDIIHTYISKHPKKIDETQSAYYARITKPLIDFCAKDIMEKNSNFFKGHTQKDFETVIQNTINTELALHTQNPTNALLYRGNGSHKDFDTHDFYDIGKNEQNAFCIKDNLKESTEMLSYGISLLSNTKQGCGGSPFFYTFRTFKDPKNSNNLISRQDLQITVVPKKEFQKTESPWFVNKKYDSHQSFHTYGVKFHPRRKTFTTFENLLKNPYVEDGFKKGDPRIKEYEKVDEACKNYKDAKVYQLFNTVGVTEYTNNKIEEAKSAYAKGISDHNASWSNYIYSLLGYKTKRDQK